MEFHKRWDKQNLILKDTFADGQLGDPLYAIVEYSQRKSIPTVTFKHWAEKTNILNYLGVHYIDLMRFVSGSIPVRTMAMGQKNWLQSKKLNTYDSFKNNSLKKKFQSLVQHEIPRNSPAFLDKSQLYALFFE